MAVTFVRPTARRRVGGRGSNQDLVQNQPVFTHVHFDGLLSGLADANLSPAATRGCAGPGPVFSYRQLDFGAGCRGGAVYSGVGGVVAVG